MATIIGKRKAILSVDTAEFDRRMKRSAKSVRSFQSRIGAAKRALMTSTGIGAALSMAGLIAGLKRAADALDRTAMANGTSPMLTRRCSGQSRGWSSRKSATPRSISTGSANKYKRTRKKTD